MDQIKALLGDMFQYQQWASERFIDMFENNSGVPDKAILLQAHLLNSHSVWLSRILKQSPVYSPWDPQPVERFRAMHLENTANTAKITEEYNLTEAFTYTTFKGDTFTNTIQDALLHVCNHNTYHRGQINQLIKAAGIDPLVVDYIFYKRDSA